MKSQIRAGRTVLTPWRQAWVADVVPVHHLCREILHGRPCFFGRRTRIRLEAARSRVGCSGPERPSADRRPLTLSWGALQPAETVLGWAGRAPWHRYFGTAGWLTAALCRIRLYGADRCHLRLNRNSPHDGARVQAAAALHAVLEALGSRAVHLLGTGMPAMSNSCLQPRPIPQFHL
jgi:hypothetical protein